MLNCLRRGHVRLAAGGVLTAVVAVAWVAGPAAGAQAALTTPARAAAPAAGIPASAKDQLASEMSAALQLTDGHGVTVALLDTPVSQISELAGKLTNGPNYAPIAGADTTDGTVIASMIAGSGPTSTNSLATTGSAPGASILAEGIINPGNRSAQEQHYESDGVWQSLEASAIRYAADHGASVIVLGQDGGGSTGLDAAVAYALAKNAVVIGTSFPDQSDANTFMYPDSQPGVINFSGTTLSGLPPPQTSQQYATNDSVLIAAPDNAIDATGPGDQPYTAWGNESAVSWVAGTVALIKSLYPKITPAMVATALATSASYHPAGGYDTTIGYGLINPVGALQAAASLVKLRPTAKPGPGVLSVAARFGATPPAAIRAVQHPVVKLAGFGAAIVVGAVLLMLAFWIRARGRRAGAAPDIPAAGAGPPPEPEPEPAPLEPV